MKKARVYSVLLMGDPQAITIEASRVEVLKNENSTPGIGLRFTVRSVVVAEFAVGVVAGYYVVNFVSE